MAGQPTPPQKVTPPEIRVYPLPQTKLPQKNMFNKASRETDGLNEAVFPAKGTARGV